jgi:hypothetical protein
MILENLRNNQSIVVKDITLDALRQHANAICNAKQHFSERQLRVSFPLHIKDKLDLNTQSKASMEALNDYNALLTVTRDIVKEQLQRMSELSHLLGKKEIPTTSNSPDSFEEMRFTQIFIEGLGHTEIVPPL